MKKRECRVLKVLVLFTDRADRPCDEEKRYFDFLVLRFIIPSANRITKDDISLVFF